jgi:uncharacterized protein
MYNRRQNFVGAENNSFFFWGARQTGKSTLLKKKFPDSMYIDLLKTDERYKFSKNPSLLRQMLIAESTTHPIIIDEVQKVPDLLDEVHWLIENRNIQFILSGSSPRKILRAGVNLLGGRAYKYSLFPLSFSEIPNFDLQKALNNGLIPKHYDAKGDASLKIAAYIGSYLEDEIIAETRIRNADVFARFLDSAAFSNGEMVNYTNIATDCGVSSTTIKEYFNILVESLVGYWLPSFQKRPKRRVVNAPKFYFFDVGIANFLLKRKNIEEGTENYVYAFEHFIFQELTTHSNYSGLNYQISYWRTTAGNEVDFILGDHEVAIEIKSTNMVLPKHLKGLKYFSEEYTIKKKIVVSNDPAPRMITDDILVLPWRVFLIRLWSGEVIN